MRTLLVSLCMLLVRVICPAQNAIFNHSAGDGFSSLNFFEANCSNGIFNHGAGDGFDSEGFLESIASGSSIFKHGMGDGFHVAHYSQTSVALNNNIFTHTDGDGFSYRTFVQPGTTSNNLIFVHGDGDGFSFATLTQSLASKNAVARVAAVMTEESSEEEIGYVIFPNPSHGNFTVKHKGNVSGGTSRVQVYNLVGAIVFDSFFQDEGLDISLPTDGLYLLKIVKDQGISHKRVVIQQ
jgi:hypothetical protein